MGNVNLPTPVVLAAGVLCLLAGYLIGVVAGPEAPDRAVATVQSYDESTGRLCLEGDAVEDLEGTEEDLLCGQWRRIEGATVPEVGDEFRFFSSFRAGQAGTPDRVLIYGDVAD